MSTSKKRKDTQMKAIVYTKFGSPENVLQLREVEKPTPRDNEVLVEIHAVSINYGDWAYVRGEPFIVRLIGAGLLKPKYRVLGSDIAGRVEAVGRNVEQFQPGDEVFGISDGGAFAEFRCAPEDYLVLKPSNMSFEETAAARAKTRETRVLARSRDI